MSTGEGPRRSRPAGASLRVLRYGALGGCLVLAGFIAGLAVGRRSPRASVLPDLGPAPAYALVNQLGRPVSSRRFAGKVQIVTFLFPYCTTFCPLIAAHLIGFERWLSLAGEENQVAVVAFNLAPEAAGPPQMRAFLGQYGWDPTDPNWQFLTGSQGEIRRVVTQGFHIAYQRVAGADSKSGIALEANEPPQLAVANPLAEKAKVDFDITHDDAIEIVDAKGRIRKIYDDGDVVSNDELWAAVRPLLAHEAGAPGPG